MTGAVGRLSDAVEEIRNVPVRILLADQSVGTASLVRMVAALKAASITCQPVLWCTDLPETDAVRLIQLGIRGLIKKTSPVSRLMECLVEVAEGRVWMETAQGSSENLRRDGSRLTPREKEVVGLVCAGLTNRQISGQLGITPGTVKVHLMHIFEKTGLRDRFALALHGRTLGDAEFAPARLETLKAVPLGVDQSQE